MKIGDKILVKILRVDKDERKIGLSKKRAEWSAEQEAESAVEPAKQRRGGLEATELISTDILGTPDEEGSDSEGSEGSDSEGESGEAEPKAESKTEPKAGTDAAEGSGESP